VNDRTVIGTGRHAAEKQNNANPGFGVLYALGHFTSSFWPTSNKYHLPIPHCGDIGDMRTAMRGGILPLAILEFDCFTSVGRKVEE
jgi:hypothetical protein